MISVTSGDLWIFLWRMVYPNYSDLTRTDKPPNGGLVVREMGPRLFIWRKSISEGEILWTIWPGWWQIFETRELGSDSKRWRTLCHLETMGSDGWDRMVGIGWMDAWCAPKTRYKKGPTTPIIRVVTPLPHLYSAVYRGPITPFITNSGPPFGNGD